MFSLPCLTFTYLHGLFVSHFIEPLGYALQFPRKAIFPAIFTHIIISSSLIFLHVVMGSWLSRLAGRNNPACPFDTLPTELIWAIIDYAPEKAMLLRRVSLELLFLNIKIQKGSGIPVTSNKNR